MWKIEDYLDDCEESDYEPAEEDYTSPDGNMWYYLGECVAKSTEELREYADSIGYFPNAFIISDHGNAHLTAY